MTGQTGSPKRALVVVVAASAAGVLVLAAFLVLAGGDDETPGPSPALDEPITTSAAPPPSTTAPANLGPGPVRATDVTCSSELPNYPCHALIDGDVTTAWNALGGGEGAEIRVRFDGQVRVTTVIFHNLADDEALTRNARARMIEIRLTDTDAVTTFELGSGHGPFRVSVTPDPTAGLVIRIVSTYPGEHNNGLEPFEELALQEITFAGIVSVP
jgi:hypothetical protein